MRWSGDTPFGGDRGAVLGCRVADVGLEVPSGMALGGPAHVAVARDLGEHRGRRDRGAAAVAVDDGALLVAEVADAEAVDQADAVLAGDAAARCAAPPGWSCAGRASRSRARSATTIDDLAAARSTSG